MAKIFYVFNAGDPFSDNFKDMDIF